MREPSVYRPIEASPTGVDRANGGPTRKKGKAMGLPLGSRPPTEVGWAVVERDASGYCVGRST